MLRGLWRLVLVVGTYFVATYAAFLVLQFVWGPYIEPNPGFWESQQGLDLVTNSIGIAVAGAVALKSGSVTNPKGLDADPL